MVTNAREHIYDMKPLEDYVYRDDQGKDLGVNGTDPPPSLSLTYYYYFLLVRQKSKEIISFLQDDERLREARKNARKTRDKFVGISSNDMHSQYSKYICIIYCSIVSRTLQDEMG